ncbi:MAG: ASCH domain-containing protein [Janthinobacterium lividum]
MILGFDEAFAPLIVAGVKIHTIRAGQRWQAGEVAQFVVYAGRPGQREFWPPQPVRLVQDIELTDSALCVDGRPLAPAELLTLAQADGFPTTEEFLAYFTDKPRPFRGQLVHWTDCRY